MTTDQRRSARVHTTCWPTPDQELLLRAALSPSEGARDAFTRWQRTHDIDDLDEGSRRLLPMVYRNLRRGGVVTRVDQELKRAYVETSVENQKRLAVLEDVLGVLYRNEVPTLVFKGAALMLFYYRDRGARPMADLDVIVPVDALDDAVGALRGAGWVIHGIGANSPLSQLIPVRHAVVLRRDDDELDLHWHVLAECVAGDLDRAFWTSALGVTIGGQATRTPAPADQLLHIFVHGLRYNPVPPVRWVADACTVLTSTNSGMDWSRLLHHAERHRLLAPVTAATEYLHRLVPGHIPPDVVEALRSLPVTRREHREFEHTTRAHRFLGAWGVEWLRYRRRVGDHSARSTMGFVSELRLHYEVKHLWQVPVRVGRGVVLRCARVFGPTPRVRDDHQ